MSRLRSSVWVWAPGRCSLRLCPRSMAAATVLSLLTLAGLLVSLSVGQVEIGPDRIVRILAGTDPDAMARRILLDIRLPRGLTAVFVGAALAVSGAVFQSVSRNALGSPDLIGFTTGAASGAIVQIVFFRSGAAGVMVAAVAGGLLTAVVVYALGGAPPGGGQLSPGSGGHWHGLHSQCSERTDAGQGGAGQRHHGQPVAGRLPERP